jgi:serine protease Do
VWGVARPLQAKEQNDQEHGEMVAQIRQFSDAFATVAARTTPGIVTVFTQKAFHSEQRGNPFAGSPFEQFFNAPPRTPNQSKNFHKAGLGSGVIVDPRGYILTNNHVIKEADQIQVKLEDDRTYEAKVVGTDPMTDLAVLKIDASDLPVVPQGNSDEVRVGEWVLAIGNPFGLDHTVTFGIVSAVGRGNMRMAEYEDFIQTDAAINPGNSGGALINLAGELVGINTAIVSRSGGNQGIGFSIPINMAHEVMSQLVENGQVRRGWLGVSIQDVTPELAKALDLDASHGAVVADVSPGTPAAEAGFHRGDVIIEINGEVLADANDLRNTIAHTPPDSKVKIGIIRDGRKKTIKVRLGELGQDRLAADPAQEKDERVGVVVHDMTPELARKLGYKTTDGVLVTEVKSGGLGDRIGIQPRDLILEINKQAVESAVEYAEAIADLREGDRVLLLIRRGQHTFFAASRIS